MTGQAIIKAWQANAIRSNWLHFVIGG